MGGREFASLHVSARTAWLDRVGDRQLGNWSQRRVAREVSECMRGFCEGRRHRASKRVFMTKHEANSSELNTEATGRPRPGAGGETGTWAGPAPGGVPLSKLLAATLRLRESRPWRLRPAAPGGASHPNCREGDTWATRGRPAKPRPQRAAAPHSSLNSPTHVEFVLALWRDWVRHTSVLAVAGQGLNRPLLRLLPQLGGSQTHRSGSGAASGRHQGVRRPTGAHSLLKSPLGK